MQERNRNVVYLQREKEEREVLSLVINQQDTSNSDHSQVSSSAQPMSMDPEDDGLHDDEEDGEAAGTADRGASCLNMNPMRMTLPAAGGANARDWITRTREMATADHVAHVGLVHEQPCADCTEPVGGQGDWGDGVQYDGLTLGGAAPGGLVLVDAPPMAVGVWPVDRRGSLVVRPRLRTRALGDTLETHCGVWTRGWGPPLLQSSAISGTMSTLHVAPVAPCRGSRRCWTWFGSRGQVAIFEFFNPGRIVSFLISRAEICANLYLPTFPARTFHAILPLCPSMESPSSTLSASRNYIIRKSASSSHHPAIFRCRGRGTCRFHTRSKRLATQPGNA
jgi:hypothetical protein